MSLALLTLSLLNAPSAQAQACGPGVYDHCWQITYSTSNNINLHNVRDVPTLGQSRLTSSQGGSNIIDGHEESTVTAILTWMPINGNFAMDPPPDKNHPVHLIEYGYAWEESLWGGSGSAPSGLATASDGLGDPAVPDSNGLISQGTHLIQRDGSSGTITLDPVTVKAINPVSTWQLIQSPFYSSMGWDWTGGEGTISFNIYLDPSASPRSVTISCPAVDTYIDGGSQYRDPPLTGPVIVNKRLPDGSLRGDTVNYSGFGNGGTILNYTANAVGNWSVGSDYHWFSSLTGDSANGVWPNINLFSVGEPFGPNIQNYDHIFISLYDSNSERAEATGNYYMHFHAQYEPTSWPEDTGYPRKQTTQIDPDVPSWPTYSWHAEVNPDTGTIDSVDGPVGATTTFPFTGTETQSWHLDGGIGIPTELVDLHFGGGYDKDITNRTSGTSPSLPTPLLRGQKTWAVWRKDIRRHKGHLDIYGIHGYTSTGVWYRDEDIGTERDIYYPYADAATENAHDPAPDWNPGG